MKVDITDNNFNNKYQIIYADPPWKYGGHGGSKWLPASNYYRTMTFDELVEFGAHVKNISADDCLLFMWCVSPELPRCIQVAESWGFKYITVAFVWHKRRANTGNYTMSGCELCLLFKKGRIPKDRVRRPGQKQFIEETISKHSAKPSAVRERIEKMFPISKKIELFSRGNFAGWDVFGDQAPED
jgi:N6-adenosine-specific RNA methylase IME4